MIWIWFYMTESSLNDTNKKNCLNITNLLSVCVLRSLRGILEFIYCSAELIHLGISYLSTSHSFPDCSSSRIELLFQ